MVAGLARPRNDRIFGTLIASLDGPNRGSHSRRAAADTTMRHLFTLCRVLVLLLTGLAALPAPGIAQTISSRSWSDPYPGVRLLTGRTTSPTTRFYALHVNLCTDYVHVAATGRATSRRSAASWGTAAGVQAATNGDFYRTDRTTPTVYGLAVGGGTAWPAAQTGEASAFSSDWYYRNYGWIAFGPGWVEFNHTEWAKRNRDVAEGWSPDSVVPTIPSGTVALVSGFPELVTEGTRYTCASPTATSCFPDRGDMRQRQPRTAMGLSEDRRTFFLVVVDGRSSVSVGMYGTELAKLMADLGAWQAFNLDGGGSSQLWLRSQGTVNAPSDGSPRSVANHWGIFAGSGSGRPSAPGSCMPLRFDECFLEGDAMACGELEAILQPGAHALGSTTDLNGDGHADVCGRARAGLRCRLGGPDGGFEVDDAFNIDALSDTEGFDRPSQYSTIRTGDINGDGLADVCARTAAGIQCWPSAGATAFGEAVVGPEFSDEGGWSAPGYYSTIQLADVDGDGSEDICARAYSSFSCWRSLGDAFGERVHGPTWGNPEGWDAPARYGSIRMGDIDGDGRADVCGRGADGVECYLSDGTAHTVRVDGPAWADSGGWNRPKFYSTIRLVDVNGDGRDDICARTSRDMRCHLSTGTGFGDAIIVDTMLSDEAGFSDHGNYATVRTGDVDGDGAIDLCVRGNAGIACYAWNGAGFDRFDGPALSDDGGWDDPMYYSTLRLADVTGDGRDDLCGRASAGMTCWPSTGRAFGESVRTGAIFADAGGWSPPQHYSTIRLAGRACVASAETCDGADNDCDGMVDEDDVCAGDGGPGVDGSTGRVDGGGDTPPGLDGNLGLTGGCGCDASNGGGAAGFGLMIALGLVLRRRRHRR
jgi:MYXO-CTERM domain-containing protein